VFGLLITCPKFKTSKVRNVISSNRHNLASLNRRKCEVKFIVQTVKSAKRRAPQYLTPTQNKQQHVSHTCHRHVIALKLRNAVKLDAASIIRSKTDPQIISLTKNLTLSLCIFSLLTEVFLSSNISL